MPLLQLYLLQLQVLQWIAELFLFFPGGLAGVAAEALSGVHVVELEQDAGLLAALLVDVDAVPDGPLLLAFLEAFPVGGRPGTCDDAVVHEGGLEVEQLGVVLGEDGPRD